MFRFSLFNRVTFYFEKLFESEKMSEKMSEKTSEKTSEKILKLMLEDQFISINKLSEIVGVSKRSIERNIKNLQNNGSITRIGSAKGGHWKVN